MIDVQIDTTEARKLFARLDGGAIKAVAGAVLRAAHLTAGAIATVVLARFREGTGQLARSFPANVGFVQQSATEVSARTFSPLPHARIQDQGGVIRPRGHALTVPLTPEAEKRMARDWPAGQLRLVVLRGKAFLVEVLGKGKGAQLRPQYVLKDQVTITGTGYIEQARKQAAPQVDAAIRGALTGWLKGGAGA